ncbi:MAG: hypothetical protein CL878_00360 [Dehalococcoidia bacterium]|nr:hypothetical protein [Dehalococcoidia bacterium]
MRSTSRELTREEIAQEWAVLDCGCHAHAVRPGALADVAAWAWEHGPHGEAGVWAVKLDWVVMQRQQEQWRTRIARPGAASSSATTRPSAPAGEWGL